MEGQENTAKGKRYHRLLLYNSIMYKYIVAAIIIGRGRGSYAHISISAVTAVLIYFTIIHRQYCIMYYSHIIT